MIHELPTDPKALVAWEWPDWEPYFKDLQAQTLTAESVAGWLKSWSELGRGLSETGARLSLAHSQNTADAEAERCYFHFIEEVQPHTRKAEQKLKEKLLASGLEPVGMAVPLRYLRAEAALFRAENLPLLVEENKLDTRYDKILGSQTVTWQGETLTVSQLRPLFSHPEREVREAVWRLARQRQLEDRPALNDLWREQFALRQQIASNAGLPSYREYAWQDRQRFDYSPEDSLRFGRSIEEVCVPAAQRLYQRRQQALGLARLRPWDLTDGWFGVPVDPPGRPALHPFENGQQLAERCAAIFAQVDPTLGAQFEILRSEGLLDLENRPHKAPGGYCTHFAVTRRPFIFMNAVGQHNDVQTLLHEAGHAFHNFAKMELPYYHQARSPMEFNEVASMAMELLAAPYLESTSGGFYTHAEANQARREHLEEMILFWPFMAVVDAFQHWAYTNPEQGADPDRCDATWTGLWERFLPGVDWSGLEAELATGWHRKLHIFQAPFYYIEYGLAAMGAGQIWRNSLLDPAGALDAYRRALALGGMTTLPHLYAAAGAHLAFDPETLGGVISAIEAALARLE